MPKLASAQFWQGTAALRCSSCLWLWLGVWTTHTDAEDAEEDDVDGGDHTMMRRRMRMIRRMMWRMRMVGRMMRRVIG